MSNVSKGDWPSLATNAGWQQYPDTVLFDRVQGWPAGTQRTAAEAERLLSQAVAWWDVSTFNDGNRFLQNRGVAGASLDARMGSSIAPNSNDPKFLAPDTKGYVYFTGIGGNNLSVPAAANLNITGDFDLRVQCSLESWPPASNQRLIGKWGAAGSRSYYLDVEGVTGYLRFFWSQDGTNSVNAYSGSLPDGLSNQRVRWVRVTLEFVSGGSNVTFYISDDGVAWTQLGASLTTTITAPTFSSTTENIFVGAIPSLPGPSVGKFYRAQIFNGINGTKVLDIDCSTGLLSSSASFSALTGQTVTINRSNTNAKQASAVPAGISNHRMLCQGSFLEIQGNEQHRLLDFFQSQSFTIVTVTRTWGGTTTGGRYLSKGFPLRGWLLGGRSTTESTIFTLSYLDDFREDIVASPIGVSKNPGVLKIASGVADRNSQTSRAYTELDYTEAQISSVGHLTNAASATRLGNTSLRGEVYAAAIFRRALTPQEIKTINNYYSARIW